MCSLEVPAAHKIGTTSLFFYLVYEISVKGIHLPMFVMSKSLIYLVKYFWATFIDIWQLFTGHTAFHDEGTIASISIQLSLRFQLQQILPGMLLSNKPISDIGTMSLKFFSEFPTIS